MAACFWDSDSVWRRESLYVMEHTFLTGGWVKSIKASWSSTSCFASMGNLCSQGTGSNSEFDMLIDRAHLSLETGDGCLPPGLSKPCPRYRAVGDGLSLGVGTVRVGDTLGWAWCNTAGGSVHCEVGGWRESLGFGFRGERVGEEFGFRAGKMEILDFAERVGELYVLCLVLGRVEAPPPSWFHCSCWQDLLQEGWADVLEEQIGTKDLKAVERKKM